MSNGKRVLVATGFGLVALGAVATVWLVAGSTPQEWPSTSTADGPAALWASTLPDSQEPDRLPPVSEKTLEALDGDGTHLTLVDPSSDASRALETAAEQFGWTRGKEPSGVSYAVATVDNYGIEGQMDPAKDSELQLLIEDRAVWVVAYDGIVQPVSGPASDDKPSLETQVVTLVILVDAESNEFLRAETVA